MQMQRLTSLKMTDWLDELFNEAENVSEKELQILEYMVRLIHTSVHSKTEKFDLQAYIYTDDFDFLEAKEIIRKLNLNQKSAFDEDMPNNMGDVARLSNERKELDDAKE